MVFHLLIAGAMAGLTWIVGWWGVALVALVVGFLLRAEGGRAWRVALGASEGWALLLVLDAFAGPMGRVATTLAGTMSIPAPALLLATLLFPALLAWSAATTAAEVGRALTSLGGTPATASGD